MASKKASESSPVFARIALARLSDVSGPVAMMTLDHASGGHPSTSPRSIVDQRMLLQRRRHVRRKTVAVHRQRRSGRNLVSIAHRNDQAARAPHLLVQQADRVVLPVVRPEGIRAHQLRQPIGLVCIGFPHWPHFMQDHRNARIRRLPGRLGPGHSAADDVDRFDCHAVDIGYLSRRFTGGPTDAISARSVDGLSRWPSRAAIASPAVADIKAFNAAVKAGDYKTAAAEAKSTWAAFDKTSPDTASVAREFGFA